MESALRNILEQEGCEIPAEDPPVKFETTESPFENEVLLNEIDSNDLFELTGDHGTEKSAEEKYRRVRQMYVNQIRSNKRNDVIKQRLGEIKRVLKDGSKEEVDKLFMQRHRWLSTIHIARKDGKSICSDPSCSHYSLPGSCFCVNHIMQDSEQKLFTKCNECGTIYPVISHCMYCKE